MNLILMRGGYPPVTVRPEDPLRYIRALQSVQEGSGSEEFERLDAALTDYIAAIKQGPSP